ncbi:MAG: hypothetical protein IPM16_13385 [Chloroflexi bacterium]|nr:hypothetical protein [Chloroflexota bacterium]
MKHNALLALRSSLIVFVFVAVIHFISGFAAPEGESWPVPIGYRFQSDSMWFVPVAASILNEGDVDLDEFAGWIAFQDNYGVREHDGHFYNVYPLGPSLFALPFVLPVDLAARAMGTTVTGLIQSRWGVTIMIEAFAASVLVAACAVLLYRIARRRLTVPGALTLVFVFAFCTSAWSTASRVLWQHGPTMLVLLIALFVLDSTRVGRRGALVVGIAIGLSYVIRPTNAIAVILFTLYILARHRDVALSYILGGLSVGIPFVIHNLTVHGGIVSPYSASFRWSMSIFEAMFGNLISPGRGLFLFTPVLLLGVVSAVYKAATRRARWIDILLLTNVGLHWIVISAWAIWWAGDSFGPRFFTGMLPFLCYFLIDPLAAVFDPAHHARRRALVAGVTVLIAASFFIHLRGTLSLETWRWNDRLKFTLWTWDFDEHSDEYRETVDHLWDWSRIQFLYNGDD